MAGFWHCLRRTYGLKLIATADHEADPFELLTKHEGRAERGGGVGGVLIGAKLISLCSLMEKRRRWRRLWVLQIIFFFSLLSKENSV